MGMEIMIEYLQIQNDIKMEWHKNIFANINISTKTYHDIDIC